VQENAISFLARAGQPVGMLNPRKLLERLVRSLKPHDPPSWEKEWEADPLSHPDLQRMTLEQLADLPFERGGIPMGNEHAGCCPPKGNP